MESYTSALLLQTQQASMQYNGVLVFCVCRNKKRIEIVMYNNNAWSCSCYYGATDIMHFFKAKITDSLYYFFHALSKSILNILLPKNLPLPWLFQLISNIHVKYVIILVMFLILMIDIIISIWNIPKSCNFDWNYLRLKLV